MEITVEPIRDNARDLVILEQIEQNPDATQASLAGQLGVAVGTINWHIKRLIAKGYVKVRHAERRKLRYIITPEGITLRAHLTIHYIETSFRVYRLVRERMVSALDEVRAAGYDCVRLDGEVGDVADVCRLTCIEQGVSLADRSDPSVPCLEVRGMKIFTHFEGNPT
ncbi:MAG: winged helix-turn-helix transcriptional regulator [Anaerolineaceae bacterium]|nr:winged helix-turn-helix transcriptional regulator [Anaerolineaceae bacterium]